MKVYIKIPFEQETKEGAKKMFDLKEIDLSELMEEFVAWKDRNYYKFDQNSYCFLYAQDIITAPKFNYKQLTEKFLTEKGYIQL